MQRQEVAAGQVVIAEGRVGDGYYLIESGNAEVWQTSVDTDEPVMVQVVGKGDSFGEEGVITGINSSTVIMKCSGSVLSLTAREFNEHIFCNLIEEVSADDVEQMVGRGAALLDVRYAVEHEIYEPIGDSLHLPLHLIRNSIHQLDPGLQYMVYCRTGLRSQVAAFLLKQRGIAAVSLKRGIVGYHDRLVKSG